MIRMLEDLTGLSATNVPLDDREVMSLFQDTHALGIQPSDIGTPRSLSPLERNIGFWTQA